MPVTFGTHELVPGAVIDFGEQATVMPVTFGGGGVLTVTTAVAFTDPKELVAVSV
ncbi:MAG TPA: hypothetical protein VGD64_11345 [Acidisarcina sp.]